MFSPLNLTREVNPNTFQVYDRFGHYFFQRIKKFNMYFSNRAHHFTNILKLGLFIFILSVISCQKPSPYVEPISKIGSTGRERISINDHWQFMRYKDGDAADGFIYDVRPPVQDNNDNKVADSKPTEAVREENKSPVLKNYILPTANAFINDSLKHYKRPTGNPGADFPFVQNTFDGTKWEEVNLPHDWAIDQPFYEGNNAIVGGGMGRLPSQGVAWYRKKLTFTSLDKNKEIYLDIDGAMSYAMVWFNGHLVGGWPYGYNSFRLNLTPYIKEGGDNQLAIRLDNPNYSARWYPGGGIYRNVWITKVNPIHIGHWGTFVTTPKVSAEEAQVNLTIHIDQKNKSEKEIKVSTQLFFLDPTKGVNTNEIAQASSTITLKNARSKVNQSFTIKKPKLWGPVPEQKPNLYKAVTSLTSNGILLDQYETTFGIRDIQFDPNEGLIVNGQKIRLKGVNQHHDLGALGAAFNYRAAQRQLEILKELGCNAIRMSHNPPAPELLDLTDQMGFLVIDEVFDSWERKKTPHDFHLVFPEWYEADIRSFIRRDRNHPSVIAWSFGNEVGEQYTGEEGGALAQKLYNIVKEEDSTRPATASKNYAKPDMPFTKVFDFMSLNYQGEGIRDAPAYAHLNGIRTAPLYPTFHKAFPDKMIVSSESASALSTRGTYVFPVEPGISAPVSDGKGGNPTSMEVSGYELYTAQFGSSPDKVFATQDQHSFVAGEFVWSGWDYLGEPTPYYLGRSSYSGIIDLAGFKKDRFFLYQARWRPELPMAHILPHWNWPDRIGQITPVHVFTSGDEAELFLNGKSKGKKKMQKLEYRLRWDDVIYEPGELKVISYKRGKKWAEETVATTGKASKIILTVDRNNIQADGKDLAFVTAQIADENGKIIPNFIVPISFSAMGSGEVIATDNGDPASLVSFASKTRKTYSGKALAIVQSKSASPGQIKLTATSPGLTQAEMIINSLK